MSSLSLRILKQLTNGCVEKRDKDAVNDDEIENLFRTQLTLKESIEPHELFHYTKTDTELKVDENLGLKVLNFLPQVCKPKAKPKGNQRKNKSKPQIQSQPQSSQIGADLLEGFNKFQPASPKVVYQLDDVFTALKHGSDKGLVDLLSINIVSSRRVLLLLMLIPLKQKHVKFNVIYWKNLIVIDYDWESEENDKFTNEKLQQLQYSGFRFEEIVTSGDFHSRYYTFVQQVVNGINLNYTAEVDGAIKNNLSASGYVELKTHSKLLSPLNLQQKLLSTWCQNKLIGCKHSVIGFRSSGFRLTSLKYYSNADLSNITNNAPITIQREYSLNGAKLNKWFENTIVWIQQFHKGGPKPKVFKLTFHRKPDLFDSELQFETIDEKTSHTIVDETVPQWFQTFFNE
jgi:hypothetical protein